MLYPSIDELLQKVDSKYTLVVAASRRARALRDGEKTEIRRPKSFKQVGIALEELYGDLIVTTAIVPQEEEGSEEQSAGDAELATNEE